LRHCGEPPRRADFVAKLDDRPLARNNRILAHKVLNQHCALAPALESILLVLAQKIVLQHNRPKAEVAVIRSVELIVQPDAKDVVGCCPRYRLTSEDVR
jgi:hypothetical protein